MYWVTVALAVGAVLVPPSVAVAVASVTVRIGSSARLGAQALAGDHELSGDHLERGRGLPGAVDLDTRDEGAAGEAVGDRWHSIQRHQRRLIEVLDLVRLGLDLVAGDRPVA